MHRNAIYVLLLTVAGLTALGMIMLFSTSAFAQESHGDIYFFVKRQGFWLFISVAAAIAAACIDYNWWKRSWWLFFGVALVLLILCFIPPIGMRINGFAFHKRPRPPSSEELAAAWRPYVETCIEAFGPARCMFESNFPVDKISGSYATYWNAFKRLAAQASPDEKAALFRETARRFYGL